MADTRTINGQRESTTSPGARLGRVGWTICAMLFVATSINYMDRQVIAILKPTLERSIRMTEVSYGYIVDAFQIAYAIGLLAFGRLIDKLGTRISYMLVMAVWSLSAMGHAMASTVLEFGFAFLSWTRQVRQLPNRDQDRHRMVSAEGTLTSYSPFTECGEKRRKSLRRCLNPRRKA